MNTNNQFAIDMYTYGAGTLKSKPPTVRAEKLARQLKGMAYRALQEGKWNTKRMRMVASRLNNELRTVLATRQLIATLNTLLDRGEDGSVFLPTATKAAGVNVTIAMNGSILSLLVGDVDNTSIVSAETAFEKLQHTKTCGYRCAKDLYGKPVYSKTLHEFVYQVNCLGGIPRT